METINNSEDVQSQESGVENNETEELLMIDNGEGSDAQTNAEVSLADATVEDNVAKLDFLGPIIVNTDGTLSRIPNWSSLTPNEQTNTMRLIAKRNRTRINILKQEEEEQEQRRESKPEELDPLKGKES
jgi:hypothetical protein